MSPASTLRGVARTKLSRLEQRSHRRYPITLDLRYKLLHGREAIYLGSGRTVNLSSRGLLFQTKEPVPEKGQIELVVNWPFLLNDACHLSLVVRGRIVRSDTQGTAVEILHHELRTAKRASAAS